jgi:PTH2 family peptidyl-tRNA hydrolase
MSDVKQVIVFRKDLNVRKGKLAAQVAHAAMKFLCDDINLSTGLLGRKLNKPEKEWLNGGCAKIVVYCESEQELLELANKAKSHGIMAKTIVDAGRTEFHGVPTLTCCAFGPDYSHVLDEITGKLKLL